jgi:hypothetical protein
MINQAEAIQITFFFSFFYCPSYDWSCCLAMNENKKKIRTSRVSIHFHSDANVSFWPPRNQQKDRNGFHYFFPILCVFGREIYEHQEHCQVHSRFSFGEKREEKMLIYIFSHTQSQRGALPATFRACDGRWTTRLMNQTGHTAI